MDPAQIYAQRALPLLSAHLSRADTPKARRRATHKNIIKYSIRTICRRFTRAISTRSNTTHFYVLLMLLFPCANRHRIFAQTVSAVSIYPISRASEISLFLTAQKEISFIKLSSKSATNHHLAHECNSRGSVH